MSMRKALTQERLFFGNITRRVHVSHEWGSLYCGDCGTWPDDYAARVPCKGPAWPAAALPDDGREGLDYDLTDAEEERLAEQLRRMDFVNWTARENAARLAGTVRAIFAARLRAALTDKP